MTCGKCGHHKKGLCPVSFGLAIGITFALGSFLCALYVMHYGVPAMFAPMAAMHAQVTTVTDALWLSLACLIKGFLLGFFIALFYDLFTCMCKCRCCRTNGCDHCEGGNKVRM